MADYSSLGSMLDPTAGLTNPLDYARQLQGFQANALNLQKLRAEQSAGEAYQASINQQTGELDPNEFRRQLAARPGAAMAAGTSLNNIQGISSSQLDMQKVKLGWYNGALGALPDNASKDQILSTIRNGVAHGVFSPEDAAREASQVPDDDAGRAAWVQQHRLTAANAMDQFHAKYGTRQAIGAGGSTEIVTVPPPGPGQPNVSVTHTPTPGERYGLVSSNIWLDKDGNQTFDPKQAVRTVPVQIPRQGAGDLPPPGPATVTVTPSAGGGNAPPSSGSGTPPVPPKPGTRLGSGAYPAKPGAQPPPAPAATPPAPTATPPAPSSTGAPAPVPGTIITGPPSGQPEEQKTDQETFYRDRNAQPQRQTQEQNLVHAYDALKLIATGKGSDLVSNVRNRLAYLGLLPAGPVSDEAALEIFRKYTERTIADAGNAGGTDAARAVAASSNPGTPLISEANLAFLRNDIGKVRQAMAPYMTAPEKSIGTGYAKHSSNIADTTDPRGFAWDMYSDAEQKEILRSVGKEGSPRHDALARAIAMGRTFWPATGPVNPVPH